MKNRLLIVASLTVLAVSLTDCSKNKLIQEQLNEQYPNEITFLPTGSEQSIVLTFNDKWRLTSPNWVLTSQSSGGEGTHVFKISTLVNRTGQDNSGVLTFDCNDGSVVTIPVTQPHPYLRISFSDDSIAKPSEDEAIDGFLHFNWDDSSLKGGRSVSVIVESNVDWRFDFKDFSNPENEFVLSKDHGFGSAELSLVPRRNNLDKQPYECLLSAVAYMPGEDGQPIGEGVKSYSFALNQKNLRFLINNDTNDVDYVVDELGETMVTLDIDSELPWSVSNNTDWVTMSTKAGESGVTQITLMANGVNPTRVERDKEIVLHSSGGADRMIRFRQNPFIFLMDSHEATFDNEGTTTVTLNVRSSGPWTAEVPSWMNLSTSGQEGNGVVILSCKKQNLNLTDLSGNVTVTSQLNGLWDRAAVVQNAFIFDVTPDETIQKIPAMSTDKYPISIQSSGAWSLSSPQPWVSISNQNGNKEGTVYVGSTSSNPDMDVDRNATITIVSETHKANGISLKKDIPLTQTKFLFSITPSSTILPAYSASSKLILDIVCSEKWSVMDYPSWLTPETTNGTFDKALVFTVAPNTNKTYTRSGKIKVRSLYNNKTLETEVTQDKFVFNVNQVSFNNIAAVDVSPLSLILNCTDEAPWEVTPSDDWLVVSALNGAGNTTLSISPKDNPKLSTRSSTLTIRSTVSNDNLKVDFYQRAYVFSVTGNSYSFGELDSSQKTISINCSSDWTIENSNSSWVNLSATSGKGSKTVTLSVKNNVETSDRKATITVYSNLQRGTADEVKQSISISQSAYKFNTKTESFTGLPTLNENGESQSVDIVCSGSWRIESAPDWISFNPSSGAGNTTLQFTPSTNTQLNDRSATFEIVSADNSNLRKRVSVSQKAYIFSVDSQKMEFTSAAGNKSCNIKSSAKWTVSTSQTWISVSTKEGNENGTLTVNVEKNSTNADRTGTVTISSQYGNHTLTIDVTQKKP